jgi:hypothetical protein
MDENNTTPPPNLPDDSGDDNSHKSIFDKKSYPKSQFENEYKKYKYKEDWHAHDTKVNKPVTQPNVYDEIVEDLIDIIAKLLKELSKRK